MRSSFMVLQVGLLAVLGVFLPGCGTGTTRTPSPAACDPTQTSLNSKSIPCGEKVERCPRISQEDCPAPTYIHSTLKRPDGKLADYEVYWRGTSKAEVLPDEQNPGFCAVKVQPISLAPPIPSYGVVGGQAPVLVGRRVRAASDGTVFAVQVDQVRKVERVVVLHVAVPHIVRGTAPPQAEQKITPTNFLTHYMVFPLDPTEHSRVLSFTDPTTPDAADAKAFRDLANAVACHAGLRQYLEAKFPNSVILPPKPQPGP